jgi:hypothetical protein
MNSPLGTTIAPSLQPALELIALARLAPEMARQHLRALLLANPNYFGNITGNSFKAVLNIRGDTTYESADAVSYSPVLEEVRAVINVKESRGYSSNFSSNGSKEYVRFYLSHDGGATWQDQGLRSVNVLDVATAKPRSYAITLRLGKQADRRFTPNSSRVRAILSWNTPPPTDAPEWIPLWGNAVDAQIKSEAFDFVRLSTLLKDSTIDLPKGIARPVYRGIPIEIPATRVPISLGARNLEADGPLLPHDYQVPMQIAAVG